MWRLPSRRNSQPWLFDVWEEEVALYADKTRLLPALDPAGRELVISCGAALFHLRLAVRRAGYEDEVRLLPDDDGWDPTASRDRTLLAVQAEGLDVAAASGVRAFVVPLGADAKRLAVRLVGQLREAGISADTVYGDRGLKGAMKAADRSGATHAVVIGDRDLAEGVGQLKDLRTGEQQAVPVDELFETVRGTVGA